MLEYLRADIDRFVILRGKPWWMELIANQGLWVMARYRFSRWVMLHLHVPILRQFLRALCFVAQKIIEVMTHCEVPDRTQIGPGMFMPHAYCIVIHQDAQIGELCTISQEVTIGAAGRGDSRGVPVLGDRIYIAPGVRAFGAISIGSDVAIGANAVVTKSLPKNAVAVGIPAKVISKKGTADLITYRNQPQPNQPGPNQPGPNQPPVHSL
ncbi:MAG: serine acetyltransferase [Cyanobacteria bacterium J06632_3]